MRFPRAAACLAVCAALALPAAGARASFHLWRIQEIFTNASGTVQFIEMFCPPGPFNNSEFFLTNQTLTAKSDSAPPVSFTMGHDLSGFPTGGRTFLFATPGFGALAGSVQADFDTLPASFFNPNATTITITFAGGVDQLAFSGSLLPKDGVRSLVDQTPTSFTPTLVTANNSPTNFAGSAGSVNAAPTFKGGDFNESGLVDAADLNVNWRTGFGKAVAALHADGDGDKDGDVDGADFLMWQQQLGQSAVPAGAAAPEPGSLALAAVAAFVAAFARRRGIAAHFAITAG